MLRDVTRNCPPPQQDLARVSAFEKQSLFLIGIWENFNSVIASIASLGKDFAEQNDSSPFTLHPSLKRKYAFTLAEVLITLGIIGVVAALTMPTIIEKHQKQVTVNKLKKAYSILSQMVTRTYADNGPASGFLTTDETVTADKSQKFFETYWLPYFNSPIVKERFYKQSKAYMQLNGGTLDTDIITNYRRGRISFSTQDGTIYTVLPVKWAYERDEEGNITSQTQVYSDKQTVYVDINGPKEPNKFGKDVFVFVIDFKKNIVNPACYTNNENDINSDCRKNGRGSCCAAKIIQDSWQITDNYPW